MPVDTRTSAIEPSGHMPEQAVCRTDAAKPKVGIIVNGRRHVVSALSIEHAEVVSLAFPSTSSASFAVTFRRGTIDQPTGFLVPGHGTPLVEDQVFHVAAAVQS